MAITLEQISTWLNEKETNHKHDTDKEVIIFAAGDSETTQSHFIRATENGEMFKWQMQLLDSDLNNIMIKDSQYLLTILSHILYMNYTTKFGTWEFDPSDGDIRLVVEIPLEDALMTQKQFSRIYGFMTRNAQEGADAVRSVLKTGKVPLDSDEAAKKIAELEAMLKSLQAASEDEI